MTKKSDEQIRFNRYLAMAGLGSRRVCDDLIQKGLVTINGQVESNPATRVNPLSDDVVFQGKQVILEPDYQYFLLNKPTQVITTTNDPYGRTTIIDLIPSKDRIYPVGRLDYDTTGAIILTNDGDLAYSLTHPKFQIPKTYAVRVLGQVSSDDLDRLPLGINIEAKTPAIAEVLDYNYFDRFTEVRLILREGRKREIKRIFMALGHKVVKLHREQFAFLRVDDLSLGKYRVISAAEVAKLKELAHGH
ncbi:MAG: rRNA pseudouridine synthase [Candidatus Marinimicrobia bacterium]|jgi:23S rRNA pseudouridine2605 synthase|nr:rRNA pseudouridine synthase [Candidatus Neomarinimicrobiota bacterium]MBT4361523.1 rRNA pseudouridine synthase [Candidatus Neomarinimicrobiota bacterium]MBT4713961.1 rRNA pseudouridine synthase [Candidatus Neomarinimicrobiota bacterium]MBT5269568.1 rRNA pseudouridine synthase [Candidatus Neomarinimicrobiota bacterium]MBT6010579.1 rRNA pseudouridine synthase [Candidatus Neomarinimicrobiota bacterium]